MSKPIAHKPKHFIADPEAWAAWEWDHELKAHSRPATSRAQYIEYRAAQLRFLIGEELTVPPPGEIAAKESIDG